MSTKKFKKKGFWFYEKKFASSSAKPPTGVACPQNKNNHERLKKRVELNLYYSKV
jgi:hypothetical protein